MNSIVDPYVSASLQNSLPDSSWASAVNKRRAPAPSSKIQSRTSKFIAFRNKFVSSSKESVFETLSQRSHYTIDDVKDAVNQAVVEYEHRGSSLKSAPLKSIGRVFSREASTVEGLLLFLPNGDYGSVLCGALTLVIHGAQRLDSLRNKILNSLGSLTNVVQGSQDFMRLYNGDKELWDLAEELYIALLDSTEVMLTWLGQKSSKHAFSAIFKQDAHGREIDNHQDLVESRVKAFHERLEFCQASRINKIQIDQDRVLLEVQDISDNIKQMHQVHETSYLEIRGLLEGLQRSVQWFEKVQQSHQGYIQDMLWKFLGMATPATVFIAAPIIAACINANSLQSILVSDTQVVASDLSQALSRPLSRDRQLRSAKILKHARFQQWFGAAESKMLVIEARDEKNASSIASATNHFTAVFARHLQQSRLVVPLIFFCHNHAAPDDPSYGAGGLISSLASQLLAHFGEALDLSCIDQLLLERVKSRDVKDLCELFRRLILAVVFSISNAVIVCVIDGVSVLESQTRLPDLYTVVKALRQLIADVDGLRDRILFKVVLAYPNMSNYARSWFHGEEDSFVTLDKSIPGTPSNRGAARRLS